MAEAEILAKYSTPCLRKQELNRSAKKDHLNGLKATREEREKILDQLYGPEASSHAAPEGDSPAVAPPQVQQGPA